MMRNLLYFLCCALFSDCNKQSSLECKLASIETVPSLFAPTKTAYEYDELGRIIKVTGIYPSMLTYYSDSIVVNDQASITTYYLAPSGLAATSKSRTPFPSTIQVASEYNYSYNAEGYLIQTVGIVSRIENGTTTRDTINWKYAIQNGNITESWLGNVKMYSYHYTNLIAKENMAFTNQPVYQWPFLGKYSKNLLASRPSSNGPIRFEYEFDSRRNIILRKEFTSYPGHTPTYYTYQCD